jgi:transposase
MTMTESVLERNAEIQATPGSGDRLIRKIRKYTNRKYTSEDKIRIVLEGFRKEISVADLCRRENVHAAIYYKWMKDFMEAGKNRLKGDFMREANSSEVKELRRENEKLKSVVGDQALQNYLLKKSVSD